MADGSIAENDGDIKKKALARLAVAGIVTILTLGVLWWLDSSGKKPPAPTKSAPSPIVTAPAPEVPKPTETAEVEAEAEAESAQTLPEEAKPLDTPLAPPPPPQVRSTPPPPQPMAAHKAAERVSPPAPTPVANQTVEKTGVQGGYLVQLGVFSDPDNAKDLVERLNKAGIKARMETRVHLGPFRNRAEAERAQTEIQRLGIKGVIARK